MLNSYIDKQIGNYRLVAEIGSGAFGNVYRGEHLFLKNRTVAIKLMHTSHLDSERERANFLQEARFLEMLKHPHILPILDVGIYEGFPYLVTEYAVKGSLRDHLQQIYPHLLSMDEALSILSQVGQGLHHAHEQNVIHRDLKPANILFSLEGQALLADFGIATTLASASIKLVKEASGSAPYMAPEQFQGMVSKEGDQYALGCIAYELFTGHLPFNAPDPFTMGFKHLTEQPPSPRRFKPDLPEYIEQAILKAMAKQRTERHHNVLDFIIALRALPEATSERTILPPVVPVAEPPRVLPNFVETVGQWQSSNAPQPVKVEEPVPINRNEQLADTDTIRLMPGNTPLPAAAEEFTVPSRPGDTPMPAMAAEFTVLPRPGDTPIPRGIEQVPTINTGSTILARPMAQPMVLPPGSQGVYAAQATAGMPVGSSTGGMPPVQDQRRRRRWPLLVALLLALILLLIPATVAAFYTFSYPATVTATITPLHKVLTNSFDITMVTRNPDFSKNQVAGARLITSTRSQISSGTATGIVHTAATIAYGSLILENDSTGYQYYYTTAGSQYTSSSGFVIVVDQSITVYPHQKGSFRIHTVKTGASSNLAAGAWYHFYDDGYGGVKVYNTSSFYGGKNAGTYTVVQQNDINNAANPLITPVKQSGLTLLQKQAQKTEQFVNPPQCTSTTSSGTSNGTAATTFNVTVSTKCTGEVYNSLPARLKAADLLKSRASSDLDPNYQLASNIVTKVTQVKVLDARHGTLVLSIATEGIWAFHFSDPQKQQLAKLINGRTVQDAQQFLSQQSGVNNVTITISGDFWIWNKVPTNLDNIIIKIKPETVPNLQTSATH